MIDPLASVVTCSQRNINNQENTIGCDDVHRSILIANNSCLCDRIIIKSRNFHFMKAIGFGQFFDLTSARIIVKNTIFCSSNQAVAIFTDCQNVVVREQIAPFTRLGIGYQ